MNPTDHLFTAGPEPKLLDDPHPHHIARWKLILVLVLFTLVVAAVGLFGYLPRRNREQAAAAAANTEATAIPRVSVARVKRAPANTQVLLPGNLSPLTESSIYARASGYVRKRYVDIGDHVKKVN